VCTLLLEASASLGQLENWLSDARAFFDFSTIASATQALHEQVESAYHLMCTANRLDGLAVRPGLGMVEVERMIDVLRADIVDTELAPMLPDPAPDAPVWTIDYDPRGGGFVARRGNDREMGRDDAEDHDVRSRRCAAQAPRGMARPRAE
jgi:hypothetical protein